MVNLRARGTRLNVSAVTNGEDVWEGTASTLPTPADAGEQMTLVSTSANDTSAGTGIRTVFIDYLDNSGVPQSETVTMNGTTEVDTVATNIRFVQEIFAASVGSNGAAVGTISIYKKGSVATVYNAITPGNTSSLNTARMVPLGHILIIRSFTVSGSNAASGKTVDLKLRSTSRGGILAPGIFNIIDNALVFNSGINREFFSSWNIPALAIVKVTAYTSLAGQDVQASWDGYTVLQ